MQDTEQHISILWNFLDLRQSLTRISSPFYQVSMFLYAPRLNKLFIYLPPTLWRWVCMSSLLYLLSKNAKALHYFILPTLGRLSNQQLESQGVDLTEIGQQTKTQYPSKGYSKPVRKISQGPLYRSWGLKKKNFFLNPLPQRNSCIHTQLYFSEHGNTTDLALSVFRSLNTGDTGSERKTPEGNLIKGTENPPFKEMHLVALRGGGEVFKVKPALNYHHWLEEEKQKPLASLGF